jgi:phage gpG-like protein
VSDVLVKVDLREVLEGIDAMGSSRTLTRGLRALKRPMRQDQREHAKANEGPSGNWPARKLKSRGRLLGRLPTSYALTVGRRSVSVVSSVRWSAVHQQGGTAGHGARIPARPFLWVSNDLHVDAAAIMSHAVREAW